MPIYFLKEKVNGTGYFSLVPSDKLYCGKAKTQVIYLSRYHFSKELTEGNKLDKATHFATNYMENKGNGRFIITSLPVEAQVSSVNTILIEDMDKDSHLDIVLAGNMYGVEVETIRNDACYGLFLKGDGKGNFKSVSVTSSGLYVPGDVKAAQKMILDEKRYIIFARNSDQVHLVEVKE